MRRAAHIALQAIGWILDLIGIFGIPDDIAAAFSLAEKIRPYVEGPIGQAALLIVGTTLLAIIYGRWLAHRWLRRGAPQRRAAADSSDTGSKDRKEAIRRWREAALAAQAEADALEMSRSEQLCPDNMIGMHEVKHILQTKPEYHEFNRVYRDELLKLKFYKRWKLRMRISRLLGGRVKPLLPNPDRTAVAGTQLHSHVYYMLRDIDRLERWWNLGP